MLSQRCPFMLQEKWKRRRSGISHSLKGQERLSGGGDTCNEAGKASGCWLHEERGFILYRGTQRKPRRIKDDKPPDWHMLISYPTRKFDCAGIPSQELPSLSCLNQDPVHMVI
ncbi:hypothetical protein H1C71_018265 [Ictidomys tridecemlineatus]|nr:hypothetical protein H1C71_018265 [Ictidomys tridecemlineatus]